MDFRRFLILITAVFASQIYVLEAKDYYELLGISRDATDRQIKKAFHKLATKYHPDKNKEKGAEDKFREIAQAYEILSDSEKRKQYDQFGEAAFNGNNGHQQNFHFNFNDFFKHFDEDFAGHNHFGGDRNSFKFSFGDEGGFDDFWSGEDGGDSGFGWSDFEDFGSRDSFFGSHFGHNHNARHSHQAQAQGHYRSTETRSHAEGGRTCKTVTQRTGNMVTTYTQCS